MTIENKLLVMCAWCKKIKINDEWVGEKYHNYEFVVESYINIPQSITHSICEDDFEKYFPE